MPAPVGSAVAGIGHEAAASCRPAREMQRQLWWRPIRARGTAVARMAERGGKVLCLVRSTGYRVRSTQYAVLGTGYCVLGIGCCVLGTGYGSPPRALRRLGNRPPRP